jgi:thiamine kinase-like enzyme
LPKECLDRAIPHFEVFVRERIEFIDVYGLESCAEIIERWKQYVEECPTYNTIDIFYRRMNRINKDMSFIGTLIHDLTHVKGTIELLRLPNKEEIEELMEYYKSLNCRTFYEILYDILEEDIEYKDGIDKLKKIRNDIVRVTTYGNITFPELPKIHKIKIPMSRQEQRRRITIMYKCILLVKKLGSLGINHNDLHGGNIMRKGDRYYLIDFGGSSQNDDRTDLDMDMLSSIFYIKNKPFYPIVFESEYLKQAFEVLSEKTLPELEEMIPSDMERFIQHPFEGRKCRYTMYI